MLEKINIDSNDTLPKKKTLASFIYKFHQQFLLSGTEHCITRSRTKSTMPKNEPRKEKEGGKLKCVQKESESVNS